MSRDEKWDSCLRVELDTGTNSTSSWDEGSWMLVSIHYKTESG